MSAIEACQRLRRIEVELSVSVSPRFEMLLCIAIGKLPELQQLSFSRRQIGFFALASALRASNSLVALQLSPSISPTAGDQRIPEYCEARDLAGGCTSTISHGASASGMESESGLSHFLQAAAGSQSLQEIVSPCPLERDKSAIKQLENLLIRGR